MSLSTHGTPAEVSWGDLGVDLALECTGKFLTPETLQGHLGRGAKRVIVAAPVKVGGVLNIVVGVNHAVRALSRPHRHNGRSASATARSPRRTTRPTPTRWWSRRIRGYAAPAGGMPRYGQK